MRAIGLPIALVALMVVASPTFANESPSPPTGLSTTVYHDRVELQWNDPGDSSITGYQILRRNRATDASGVFAVILDDTGSSDTRYTDSTVEPETRYVYRVKARNSHGLSEQSSYADADTPAAPATTTTPEPTSTVSAQPTGLRAVPSHDKVELSWNDPNDDSITGYQILRRNKATDASGVFAVILDDTGSSDTRHTDSIVEPETRYVYRVKARNSHGLSEQSSYADADTPAAPATTTTPEPTSTVSAQPTGLRAVPSHDKVELSWNDPNDDSITGYQILRRNKATDASGVFAVILDDTGSSDTRHTDSIVEPETRYVYRVKARNSHGLSEQSSYADADTPVAPSEPMSDTPVPTPEADPVTTFEPDGQDFPRRTHTSGYIVVGENATGTISRAGDRDWFRVDLEADTEYQINLRGDATGNGTLTDPRIPDLRDTDGSRMRGTGNDNANDELDSEVLFTPDESGSYWLVAASRTEDIFSNHSTGTYTLYIKLSSEEDEVQTDDVPGSFETLLHLAVDAVHSSQIDFVGDEDWYKIYLQKDVQYTVSMRGSENSTDLTLDSTWIRTIYDPGQSGSGFIGVKLSDEDSYWCFTPDETGTFTVVFTSFNKIGTYEAEIFTGCTALLQEEGVPDYFYSDSATTADLYLGGLVV